MIFKVYYAINPLVGGFPELYPLHMANLEALPYTHTFVTTIEAATMGEAYALMQSDQWGIEWSPAPHIEKLCLNHSSMCNGDVIEDEQGDFYECMAIGGWRKMEANFAPGHVPSSAEIESLIQDEPPAAAHLSYIYKRIKVPSSK